MLLESIQLVRSISGLSIPRNMVYCPSLCMLLRVKRKRVSRDERVRSRRARRPGRPGSRPVQQLGKVAD